MSRSFRRNPVLAPSSSKEFKGTTNRKFRTAVRKRLHNCADYDRLVIPVIREVSDLYDSPKDGCCTLFGAPHDDPDFPKYLRK